MQTRQCNYGHFATSVWCLAIRLATSKRSRTGLAFFSAAFVTEFYFGIYERLNISPTYYRQSDMLGFVAVWPSV